MGKYPYFVEVGGGSDVGTPPLPVNSPLLVKVGDPAPPWMSKLHALCPIPSPRHFPTDGESRCTSSAHLAVGRHRWRLCRSSLHGRGRGGGTRVRAGARVWFHGRVWAGVHVWMGVCVCVCVWARVLVVFVVAFGMAVVDMGLMVAVRSLVAFLST